MKSRCAQISRTFLLAVFILFYLSGRAQEGVPIYFDYLTDNYYLVYPSMAGIGEGGKARLTARQQWFDIQDAPSLQTFNLNWRLNDRSGVGGILFNDSNGYHSQTGFKGTYAHHIKLSYDFRTLHQLSFGLSAGVTVSSLNFSEFPTLVPDPVLGVDERTLGFFNVDAGVSYNLFEFYAHFAVLNLLGQGRDRYSGVEFDNFRRYLLSAGYVFGRGSFRIEPSFLLQLTEFTNERTLDLNLKLHKDLNEQVTLFAGASYRRTFEGTEFFLNGQVGQQRLQMITPWAGARFNRFLIAYNYSYQIGDIRIGSGGFHQITLGYDLGEQPENRYDCYCPAANN